MSDRVKKLGHSDLLYGIGRYNSECPWLDTIACVNEYYYELPYCVLFVIGHLLDVGVRNGSCGSAPW